MRVGRLWAIAAVFALICATGLADVIEPGPVIIFRFGDIYVRETIDIKAGAELGSIDSNFPLCLETQSSEAGAIRLGAGVVVPGDVFIRFTDVVKVHPSAVIEGDIRSAYDMIVMPPVMVPPHLLEAWSYGGNIAGANVTINGDGWYDAISIERGGILTVSGDANIYVVGDINIGRDAQVVVTSGSTLTLYLGGKLLLDIGSAMSSADGEPDGIQVFGTDYCESIELRRNSALWGSIYAPETRLLDGGTVVGRFMGRSATISNCGSFYCPTLDWPFVN